MTPSTSDLHVARLVITPGDHLSEQFVAVRGHAEVATDPVAPGTEALLLFQGGAAVARASLYVEHDLVGAPGCSGLIGHYEAVHADAGVALLEAAHQHLVARGVQRVLGPMNGSTWSRYRLALPPEPGEQHEDARWFAGEPRNAPDYPSHWQTAGFAVVARYESRSESLDESVGESRSDALGKSATASASKANDIAHPTVRIRRFALDRFDEELESLHRISLDAFADNSYYAPIEIGAFRAIYAQFRDQVDASFVLLAEQDDGDPVGFVVAYADPNSVVDGRTTRVIVKTLATVRAARGQRVSSTLLDAVRTRARQHGFLRVVSALMRSDNTTRGMAARRDATLLRRYALYERGV